MRFNLKSRKGIFFIAIPVLLAAFSALFFVACQKSNDNNLNNGDDQGGYASDASRMEWATDDIISIADAAGQVYNGVYMGGGCTVATDTTDNTHVLLIRFYGNVCADGRTRSGAIIVSYGGEYSDTAQIHTITFDNYIVNGNQVTGSITTERVDTTIVGNWYYRVGVDENMILDANTTSTNQNAQMTTWVGNLVRKWVAGYASSDRSTEIFSISGSANLTRADNNQFYCQIAVPLQFALDCNFCESGVVNVTGTLGSRILNYGTGTCDPYAQLNVGVHVYQLTLTQ